MARPIQASQFAEAPSPVVANDPIVAAQTFKKGAPLTLNAGAVQEHAGGSTVTGLYGFALFGATSGAPSGGFGSTMGVSRATRTTVFSGEMLTGGAGGTKKTDLSAVTKDQRYGLIKSSAGDWYVDFDDTTDVMVEIVGKDPKNGIVLFKVIESALQIF